MGESMSQTYKVLVVDDEEVLRDLFQRICTAKGHQVIQAGSGEEAVDILKSQIQNPKSKPDEIRDTK
jgi:CheY-like chemotaxis protein